MDIRVLDSNPLYLNETYRLKFTFGKNYPIGMVILPLRTSIRAPQQGKDKEFCWSY